MVPPARWTKMESPVKPANDAKGGRFCPQCLPSTPASQPAARAMSTATMP